MDQASSATVDAPRRWTGVVRLPEEDLGVPDTRSPARLLLWVGRHQIPTLVAGVFFGILWMVAQSLMPFAIGQAIEDGIEQRQPRARGVGSCAARSGAVQAGAGIMRHRYAVFNWLQASFRMAQVVSHHSARSGPAVRGRLSTGEVVATVSNDAMRAGGAFDITARLSGSIVAYVVVAFILLSASVVLGLIVLVGVPVLVLLLGFVIKPLQERQRDQREEVGKLTALGADTAAGLRVLRGIGGEQAFYDRYHHRSQEVRHAGVRVALPQSTLDAAQVFVPGLFVVLVTWLGARFAVSGRIDVGELVAFYGYAAFLVIPLRTAAEAVDKITRAFVGARRMLDVLTVEPHVADPESPADEPPSCHSWTRARPRRRARARHLHRLLAAPRLDGDRGPARTLDRGRRATRRDTLEDLCLSDVRRRIVVSEADPVLFAGTLRSELDPWGRGRRRHPPGDLRRECGGHPGGASRGARRRRRRARPVVLGRAAPAARPGPRASRRPRGARPRRADERRRRPHRGEDRAPAPGRAVRGGRP